MHHYCFRREFLRDADETELKQPVSNCSTHPFRVQRFYSDNEVTLGQRSALSCSEGSAQPDNNEKADYDFYLAVAEKDLETFGLPFATMVERRMGMRPCLTLRDIVPGTALYETMAKTLETRCNGKVVFVLSKFFNESDECQFLVHFAKTLDPYARQQKLIPLVIDKGVQLPRVLEGLVCINYNAALRENWLGKRLWDAVHGGSDGSDQRTIKNRTKGN